MVEDKEQIVKTLKNIVSSVIEHGEGKIEVLVSPHSSDKTKIKIVAGKCYTFIVDKFIED